MVRREQRIPPILVSPLWALTSDPELDRVRDRL